VGGVIELRKARLEQDADSVPEWRKATQQTTLIREWVARSCVVQEQVCELNVIDGGQGISLKMLGTEPEFSSCVSQALEI
jgi:hypothetical protein